MMCFSDKFLDSVTTNLSPKCDLLYIVNLLDFKDSLETSVPVNIRFDLKGG
jgi:hypothetical protein